jgi:protein ImuA
MIDDEILQQFPHVWRANHSPARGQTIPTGFAELDQALGGGWPNPALIELLNDSTGIGELQLLLPLLRHQLASLPDSVVLWINPPYTLNAVALMQVAMEPSRQWIVSNLAPRDVLWSMECALRSGAAAAVLAWSAHAPATALRRLKLASMSHEGIGILIRPSRYLTIPSPASVRAHLQSQAAQLKVELTKVQGGRGTTVILDICSRIDRDFERRRQ